MIRRVFACLSVLLGSASAARGQTSFVVSFAANTGALTAVERAMLTSHFIEAGRRWCDLLKISGSPSIEIEISVNNSLPRFSGRSQTTSFVGTIEGRSTFEQGMAREIRSGVDPNGGKPDVLITVNIGYLRNELWFDPDPGCRTAPVPITRTDAMSVALHELGHALAYNGWANLSTGEPPLTFWSIWDRSMRPDHPTRWIGDAAGEVWGEYPALTAGNIHHWGNGPTPTLAPSGDAPEISSFEGAPAPLVCCNGPASADFMAEGSDDLLSLLMNGVVFLRGHRYEISELDRAVLKDVGLPVGPARCAGDLSGDGVVDTADLNAILADFGGCYGVDELNAVLGAFGSAC